MSVLAQAVEAVASLNREVEAQIRKAGSDRKTAATLRRRWRQIRERVPMVETVTGLKLPRLALPQTDQPSEIASYLFGEGLPGEFPFMNGAYPEMYLQSESSNSRSETEEPTRLFAGLGLAEETNRRFHYLTRHQQSVRLSTAFDSPTLYGL